MSKVNVIVDFTKKREEIEPNLFAHNLEHTRASMFYGLSAQLIRNRKFAGKPMLRDGQAAEWYRIGGDEMFLTLDMYTAYVRHTDKKGGKHNECNTQVVQNPLGQGLEAGVGQAGLPLRRGQGYEVRAVIRGRGEAPVTCCIRVVNRLHTTTYVSRFVKLPQNEWHKIAFAFVASADDDDACFEVVIAERGEISIGVVSLLPDDHCMELRRDVIDLLKELGPSILRWPGGNFAGEYRWKDGLMEPDMRGAQCSFTEIETHPYTHGFDFHEMNVDNFIQVCRMVGAKPYITINLAWDSPAECAEFVEYCNGGAHTKWGAVRVERGHPEPYNVRYWSLGNELGYGHMEGPNTPTAYTEWAIKAADAMREVDPDLVLFSSGAYNPSLDGKRWVEESLSAVAKHGIAYISYHEYVRLFDGGVDFVTGKGLEASYEAARNAAGEALANLRALRGMMNAGDEDMKKVHISFDEWNMFFAWYHEPCVIEGIYTGLMLEMFCKNYKELDMPIVMYFEPVNEGAIVVKPYEAYLSANGQVFALMKAHQGGTMLEAAADDEALHCLASEKGGNVTLTLINTAYDKAMEVELDLGGRTVKGARLLEGKSLLHASRFSAADLPAGGTTFALPAHSFLQLQF